MMSSHDYGDARGGAGDGKVQDQDQDQDQAVPAAARANAAAAGDAVPKAEGEGGGKRDLRACFDAKNTSLVQYVHAFEAEGFEDVELVSEMDADDCDSVLAQLDEGSIKKPHRKKLAKVLAALMRDGGDGGGGNNDDAGGVDVETWLTSVHKSLTPFAKVFTEMGYDNFDLIRDIDAGDRDDILTALDTAEIKKVSEARFVRTTLP